MLETIHVFFFETTQSFHGRKRKTENKNIEETKKNRWKKPGLHQSSNKRYLGFETYFSKISPEKIRIKHLNFFTSYLLLKRRRRQQQQQQQHWI
jgi:hypothetical protein